MYNYYTKNKLSRTSETSSTIPWWFIGSDCTVATINLITTKITKQITTLAYYFFTEWTNLILIIDRWITTATNWLHLWLLHKLCWCWWWSKTEKVQWKLWVYFSTPFYHLLRIEFQLSLLSHYWLIDWILSRFGSFSGIVTRLLYHRMFTWSSTINYTWIGPNQIAKGLALFTSRQSNLELLGSILERFMHASLF